MRECAECDWMVGIDNSRGERVYFCMDVEGGAYMQETGICGNCSLDEED